MKIAKLAKYIDKILKPQSVKDYCPNGIQLTTDREIKLLVSGVTASLALIKEARKLDADVLLVHHGYFWRDENAEIVGMKSRRIGALMKAKIGLLAYHLPLDIHPVFGNNAMLAKRMGWKIKGAIADSSGLPLLMYGKLQSPCSLDAMRRALCAKLGKDPLAVSGGSHKIRCLAWCTGAAQDLLNLAARHRFDAYISGEISERTTHIAREEEIHYFAAGHHATERYGVQEIGRHLAKKFGLEHHFVDIHNPV